MTKVKVLTYFLQELESIDTIFSSPDKNKIGSGEDVLSRGFARKASTKLQSMDEVKDEGA